MIIHPPLYNNSLPTSTSFDNKITRLNTGPAINSQYRVFHEDIKGLRLGFGHKSEIMLNQRTLLLSSLSVKRNKLCADLVQLTSSC